MESIVEICMTDDVTKPYYATPGSAGLDVHANLTTDVVINPGKTKLISTGLKMKLPPGFEAQIRSRSGLALKYGIVVLNAPGTIDSDYRGEVKIMLHNTSDKDFVVLNGTRIAQIVIAKYVHASIDYVDVLSPDKNNQRGVGGFGSTGDGV